MDFLRLKKNLKKDASSFPVKKIALLGDSATQLLSDALKGYAFETKMRLDVFEADYDQIESQILSSDSELYRFEPEFIAVFYSTQHVARTFYKSPVSSRKSFADDFIGKIENLVSVLERRLPRAKVVIFSLPEIDDSIFGSYATKVKESFGYQISKLNLALMDLAQSRSAAFVCDVRSVVARHGHAVSFDSKMAINADMVFSLAILPEIAKRVIDIVLAISGRFKKCLILDLDNTTWGGIIGDDGIDRIQIGDLGLGKAFNDLQLWAKELKNRGIILAVCSKNDQKIAEEPFHKHPDMILKFDDIAVFIANWESKVQNIRSIQSVLNISFDSMVFLDDNPFERNVVREHLPDVTVPELPEDPAEYVPYLRGLNLFETASYSKEDGERTDLYRVEAQRAQLQAGFVDEREFLATLSMTCEVRPFDSFNTPRVSQLTQRSNQFNLRTVRYTEAEIAQIAKSDQTYHLAFSLKDKFGDYGLISAIILKAEGRHLFIDTWIMSCRVLKRGMEQFVLNEVMALAVENGYARVIGEYLPTPKNGLVKEHYTKLGFSELDSRWTMDVDGFEEKEHFILRSER